MSIVVSARGGRFGTEYAATELDLILYFCSRSAGAKVAPNPNKKRAPKRKKKS